MNQTELTDFGTRDAAAWSSQHPASPALFQHEMCLYSQWQRSVRRAHSHHRACVDS